jgi:hypothetical protein
VTWGELERGGDRRRSTGLDLDAFTGEELFQVFHFKARDTAFEKGITLGELVFEMFGVATEGESLTMPVFLVAGGSGGSTSGASRVLRVAL